MAYFPVITSFSVKNYGLYPGHGGEGFEHDFLPGITLALGANGIGKSTLIWMMYRTMSGPNDLTEHDSGSSLSGGQNEVTRLQPRSLGVFADRVSDRAAHATSRMSFVLGSRKIVVTRAVANLTLVSLEIDEVPVEPLSEDQYQSLIWRSAGLASFSDWLLMIRHVTFYLDERRNLLWAKNAQRQLLRLLFLSPDDAGKWARLEGSVMALDSSMRNFRHQVNKEQATLDGLKAKVENSPDIRREIALLEAMQAEDQTRAATLAESSAQLEELKREARLRRSQIEIRREEAFRDYERFKMSALEASFPSSGDTFRYLYSQILAAHKCLACGSDVPNHAKQIEERLSTSHCVVCGTQVEKGSHNHPEALSELDIDRLRDRYLECDLEINAAESEFVSLGDRLKEVLHAHHRFQESIIERSQTIRRLRGELPPEDARLARLEEAVADLQTELRSMVEELSAKRNQLAGNVDEWSKPILAAAETVRAHFEKYANGFLFEKCRLTWKPIPQKIGQDGPSIPIPTYELDLSSSVFGEPTRRTGPEQVSQSQKEFIDLAFRVALMLASDATGAATMIIDAPESSLDSVFVTKASTMLALFSRERQENRLFIASNLTEGRLIPELLKEIGRGNVPRHVVDLFDICEPTAAIRQNAEEYKAARDRYLKSELE